MSVGRRLAASLLAAVLVVGCGAGSEPSSSAAPASASASSGRADPSATASAVAVASLTPLPSTTPSPTAMPSPTATPSPTPLPTPPTAASFWERAVAGVASAGRLRLRVIGPAPGELRYEADASATVIGGQVVFVCRDGAAWDGQSGWSEVPGDWACGAEALVAGFRRTGQPLDGWSDDLSPDEDIEERLELLADGTWRWTYRGRSPFAGGDVRTDVVLDPQSGQLRSASRSDPTGDTTYGISYREQFPPIAVP